MNQLNFEELLDEEQHELFFDIAHQTLMQPLGFAKDSELIDTAELPHNDDGLKEDSHNGQARPQRKQGPVSRYRREHLRYLRGQPKKVYIQIICKAELGEEKSSVFEIDLDTLTCKTDYIDAGKRFQVIFQTQSKNGVKHLLIRSPMLITNNLQIPLELHLMKRGADYEHGLLSRSEHLRQGSGLFPKLPSSSHLIMAESD